MGVEAPAAERKDIREGGNEILVIEGLLLKLPLLLSYSMRDV